MTFVVMVKGVITMYESPIELVVSQFQTEIIKQQENQVIKAVQNVGVNVDKAELLRALSYDRDQYEKGYADGYEAGRLAMLDELKRKLQVGEYK